MYIEVKRNLYDIKKHVYIQIYEEQYYFLTFLFHPPSIP